MDLSELCDRLRRAETQSLPQQANAVQWPVQQLNWCAEAGVFRWFVPREYGGWHWSDRQQIEGYLALSQASMTTAFVLT